MMTPPADNETLTMGDSHKAPPLIDSYSHSVAKKWRASLLQGWASEHSTQPQEVIPKHMEIRATLSGI